MLIDRLGIHGSGAASRGGGCGSLTRGRWRFGGLTTGRQRNGKEKGDTYECFVHLASSFGRMLELVGRGTLTINKLIPFKFRDV